MNKVTAKTTGHLIKALEKRQPVTVTYTDRDGETTVRTIEIQTITTTTDGAVRIMAACSLRREIRGFSLDRIDAYTVHARSTYRLNLTAPDLGMAQPQERKITALTSMFATGQDIVDNELGDYDYAADLAVKDCVEVFDISKAGLKAWAKGQRLVA